MREELCQSDRRVVLQGGESCRAVRGELWHRGGESCSAVTGELWHREGRVVAQ